MEPIEAGVGIVAVGPVIVSTELPFTVETFADTPVVPVRALICPSRSVTVSPAPGTVMVDPSMEILLVGSTVPLVPKL